MYIAYLASVALFFPVSIFKRIYFQGIFFLLFLLLKFQTKNIQQNRVSARLCVRNPSIQQSARVDKDMGRI